MITVHFLYLFFQFEQDNLCLWVCGGTLIFKAILPEAARGLGVLVEVGFSLIPVNQGVWGGPQLPEAPTGGETGRLQLGSKTKLT